MITLKSSVSQTIRVGLFIASITASAGADYAAANSTYNYAPSTRTLFPVSVFKTSGTVTNPTNVISGAATRLSGNGSYITVDYAREVGGIVTLSFAGASAAGQSVGLAFSESSLYAGTTSDASNGGSSSTSTNTDGAIYATVNGSGSYTMPKDKLRGGFRYLTIFMNSSGWVDLDTISLNYTIAPAMSVPNAYLNYFSCNDTLLTRIWYAGAYTVQSNLIAPTQGRVWPAPSSGWEDSATIGTGATVLVDGAKRDRIIWPGDMGISVPSAYYSVGDVLSAKNSLITMYSMQKSSTGELPFAGKPVSFYGSDTYHLWTLVGTGPYYLFSGDKSWLDGIWAQYKKALAYSRAKIDTSGLMNVTSASDWARSGQGGYNIEANCLLYNVLTQAATLATVENNITFADSCILSASTLKTKINQRLWNAAKGAFRDNPTSALYPQDGNSLAAWFRVVNDTAQAKSICAYLKGNWNAYGSTTPEWGNNIATFPGSMEVQAHFSANDDSAALALIRLEWGYMLNSANGTKCTFWEGFNANGAFAYYGNYMSCAHGWATGPTSALSAYVLGIRPLTASGQTWSVEPHSGDLTHAEGQLAISAQGTIAVSWDRPGADTFSLTVNSSTATGTSGAVAVPRFGKNHVVYVNNVEAWNGTTYFVGTTGIGGATQDSLYIRFTGVAPAARTFTLSKAPASIAPVAVAALLPDAMRIAAKDGRVEVRVSCPGEYCLQIITMEGKTLALYHGRDHGAFMLMKGMTARGVYFARLTAGNRSLTKKIMAGY